MTLWKQIFRDFHLKVMLLLAIKQHLGSDPGCSPRNNQLPFSKTYLICQSQHQSEVMNEALITRIIE